MKRIIYFLINLLTGGRGIERTINHFKVRFPARWSRYYEPAYEKDNYTFLQNKVKPGMHIIDVGAHLGLFSVISSQLTGSGGKVVCFEPTPGTYAALSKTLKINHCKNVIAVQGAVSNKEGTSVFYVSETGGCNSNSLVKNISEQKTVPYEVKLFTIDGIVQQYSLQPGLIKIDAEGAEWNVVQGGLNTFRKFKPTLILGLHPAFIDRKGDKLEDIWDALQESGYEIKENENSLTRGDFCNRKMLFDVHCIVV